MSEKEGGKGEREENFWKLKHNHQPFCSDVRDAAVCLPASDNPCARFRSRTSTQSTDVRLTPLTLVHQ